MYQMSTEDRAIIKQCLERRDEANATSLLSEQLTLYNDLIENKYSPSEEDKRDYGKDVAIPEALSQYKNVVAKLLNPFFMPGSKYIYAAPNTVEDIGNAQGMEKALQSAKEAMNFDEFLKRYVCQGARDGTVICKVGWERVYNGEPIDINLVREGATLELREIQQVFVDPKACDIDKAEYVIDEVYVLKDAIVGRMQSGEYDVSKQSLLDEPSVLNYNTTLTGTDPVGNNVPGRYTTNLDITPNKYKITEYWSRNRVIAILNECVILRDTPNPYYDEERNNDNFYPFFEWRYFEVVGKFYGQSFFADITDLQYGLNVFWNLLLDNLAIAVRPAIIVEDEVFAEQAERENIKLKTGRFIKATGRFEAFSMPSVSAEIYQAMGSIRQFSTSATGVTDQLRGLPDTHKETASSTMQRAQSAQGVFDLIFRDLCKSIRKIWQFISDSVIKFQVNPMLLRSKAQDGTYLIDKIRRDQFNGNFDIIIEIDPAAYNKNLRIEQLQNLIGTLAPHPWVDIKELDRRLLTEMGIPGVNQVLLSDTDQFRQRFAQSLVDMSIQDMLPKVMMLLESASPEEFAMRLQMMLEREDVAQDILNPPDANGQVNDFGMPSLNEGTDINSMTDMMKARSSNLANNSIADAGTAEGL